MNTPARQLADAGFSIVEVIANCPVGWGMTPQESIEHLRSVVPEVYPPGILVDRAKPAPGGVHGRAR